MPIVRREQCRRCETPNAVMTTLASPTLGGAECAIWRLDMNPGQAGPLHLFDREQVWTVVAGGATVELGPQTEGHRPGRTRLDRLVGNGIRQWRTGPRCAPAAHL